jgi:hypothetical protein
MDLLARSTPPLVSTSVLAVLVWDSNPLIAPITEKDSPLAGQCPSNSGSWELLAVV